MKNNLLSKLFTYSAGQGENFISEAFAFLLQHLANNELNAFNFLIKKMTNDEVDFSSAQNISISTQVSLQEGRPDIEIKTIDTLIFIEVKVDSGLQYRQIERYKNELDKYRATKTALILLSRFPLNGNTQPDYSVRWLQIGQWLSEIISQPLNPVSLYLVNQFLEFLRTRYLSFELHHGNISFCVHNQFLNPYEKNILIKPIRSLTTLSQHKDLLPLHSLFHVVRMSLHKTYPKAKIKLWSGKTDHNNGNGWIGYNIDKAQYFLCIYYDHPDVLVFETFRYKIDPEKHDGSYGFIFESYGSKKWKNEFLLEKPDDPFIDKTLDERINLLVSFIESSLLYSEKIHLIK